MNRVTIPQGYTPPLNTFDTQLAIEFIKHNFQQELAYALNLRRVSAPLFVSRESGLNDNLNGVERPVSFDVPAVGADGEVVHSLAKWKRLALKRYDFHVGRGLYTDMNAIRRDEGTAQEIVHCVVDVSDRLRREFPSIHVKLNRNMACVTTQELEDMYPDLPEPRDREDAYLREHGTALIMQIGGKLKSGKPHDGRAPDYDDWTLNGDILFWNELLGRAFEISSMGIRVDAESLDRQLTLAGCDNRRNLPFHKMLLNDELPLTIGGGIGQSRLCMLMMGVAHIGEVQSSLWDDETSRICAEKGILLL